MKQKNNEISEVEDKVFGKMVGKIIPETLLFGDNVYDLSFDFRAKDDIHRFRTTDRRVVTKICQLYDISHRNTVSSLKQSGKKSTELFNSLADELRHNIKNNDRTVVLLLDSDIKPVSVVSEEHKQLPLSKAFSIVDSVAKTKKAVFVTKRDTGDSYVVEYEVGRNSDMSIRVTAYLGRNDALGRSGIRFEGGGNIFVCSNMIVPYIDRSVMTTTKNELMSVKIVHTLNVEQRLKEQLIKSFDYAKKNSLLLAKKFTESKSIKMSRELQAYCIDLIRIKHNLPDKWNYKIMRRLQEESETLYGLSQALTYVASHMTGIDSVVSKTLQRIGGQVVLLGEDFVVLMKESIHKMGLVVPTLKST